MEHDDYPARLSKRMDLLERSEINARQDTVQTKIELARLESYVKEEMRLLNEELLLLQKEIDSTVNRVKITIDSFKGAAKKGDFIRLQSRADALAFDKKITRKQLNGLAVSSFLNNE